MGGDTSYSFGTMNLDIHGVQVQEHGVVDDDKREEDETDAVLTRRVRGKCPRWFYLFGLMAPANC
jgi:hypothetical protein